jgi:hypothetical protein
VLYESHFTLIADTPGKSAREGIKKNKHMELEEF